MKSSSVIGVVWYAMVLLAVVWQALRSRSHWLSWLVVGLVGAWGVHWFIRSRKEKREGEALAEWQQTLKSLVDVRDFEDDGHLHEWFEPAERERLVEELQRMPRGSRSLRRAIEIVNPELIRDDDAPTP